MWRQLLSILFSFSLVLYLILFLLESVVPGVVSSVFSLNYFLYPVLIFGIGSAIFPLPEVEPKQEPFHKSDLLVALILSFLGAGLIYYKIDLEPPLRQIISGLSGILILLTSVLVVLPEDYEWHAPKISRKYLVLVLIILVPTGIWGLNKIKFSPSLETTAISINPADYQIVLYNHSGSASYINSYKQILSGHGYVIVGGAVDPDPGITSTTVMFGEGDAGAGNQVADILRQTYSVVLTAPLATGGAHQIIVILGEASAQ